MQTFQIHVRGILVIQSLYAGYLVAVIIYDNKLHLVVAGEGLSCRPAGGRYELAVIVRTSDKHPLGIFLMYQPERKVAGYTVGRDRFQIIFFGAG